MRRPTTALATILLLASAVDPAAAQAPPTGDVVVVASQGDATVHILDAESGARLARVDGFDGPHEVAISADGRWAVVSDYGTREIEGRRLHVLDLESFRRVRVIELGEHRRPHDLWFLPDGRLAVTSEKSQAVLLVDIGSGQIDQVLPTGAAGSHMLAATGDGARIFTANMGAGSITELDVQAGRAVRIEPVAPANEGIAVSPDGTQIWVTSLAEQNVRVLDGRTLEVLTILPAAGHPYRVTVSPDGARAFVPGPAADILRVFDTATFTETTVAIPGGPGKVTVGPDGGTAYLPLHGSGEVAVLDLESLKVLKRIPAGPGPDGLGVSAYHRKKARQ